MQLEFAPPTLLMCNGVALMVIFSFLQMGKQFGIAISLEGEKPKLVLR